MTKAFIHTAHKMKFSIKDFFSKCVHIRRYFIDPTNQSYNNFSKLLKDFVNDAFC